MSKTYRKFHGEDNSNSRKRSTKGKQSTSQVNRVIQLQAMDLIYGSTSKQSRLSY